MDETLPEMTGPYSDDFGQCAYNHPVNAYGRCEPLNNGQEIVASSDNPGEAGEAGN